MYRVIMLNDDFTTQDFVVDVLINIFKKTSSDAFKIMMNIHTKGSGDCGIYIYDIARTKVMQVKDSAKRRGFPLRCTIEEA